ncbi:MAG: GNAT family N-acetyltransferase [Chloroflexota bacterium]|nr:GNAT family N-acetyltransferase [Chloroflexota bacterium]
MQIRDVRPEEYAVVGDLVVDVYRSIIPDLDEYADELRDVAGRVSAGVHVWIVEEEGAIAGTVSYVPGPGPYAEWPDPLAGGIRMLAVLPAFEGRGIGEALVRACLDRARADGRLRVYLHTTQWMEAAQRLYRRIGFVRAPALDWLPVPEVALTAYVYELAPESRRPAE